MDEKQPQKESVDLHFFVRYIYKTEQRLQQMERVRATWQYGIIVVRRSKKRHRQDWKDNPRRRIFFAVGLYVKYNMPPATTGWRERRP
jgi:hypothetical protein